MDKEQIDQILTGWRVGGERALSLFDDSKGIAVGKVRSLITLWLSENELKMLHGVITKKEYDRRVLQINNEIFKMTTGRSDKVRSIPLVRAIK
jgi:hypothetical protein